MIKKDNSREKKLEKVFIYSLSKIQIASSYNKHKHYYPYFR